MRGLEYAIFTDFPLDSWQSALAGGLGRLALSCAQAETETMARQQSKQQSCLSMEFSTLNEMCDEAVLCIAVR